MTTQPTLYSCPLCASQSTQLWHRDQRRPVVGREYWQCANCQLVFVPKAFHLDPSAEKAIYDLHQNDPDDAGYRRFLSRAQAPILRYFANRNLTALRGLDFGCGPGPALTSMLGEHGIACVNYDPFYFSYPELLEQRYDFIVSTEVFEHLSQPYQVLEQIVPCLKPDGLLVIMTQRPRDLSAFSRWGYTLDPTHISFFREASFHWIARHFQLELIEMERDVVVFANTLKHK
ncbi:MAG: class I SAM-dependent methyltransferase [Aliidiomarina sp.]|uniref:class I SAM-dependent methyltransferase n=1 Tax=Aliidiomarina sp. TaxID=1872439 RepID=UPI0025C2AFF9|nr:class I SAM-dependent methyltransferase [Aliidiomarina sp.]MCH8500653.1 class I SAM-dependent methyltransferase [Aliidiomarina sp.]